MQRHYQANAGQTGFLTETKLPPENNNMNRAYVAIFALLFIAGCYFFPYSTDIVSEKFSASKLQQDFTVFRTVLERAHPGLYSYTGEKELDNCFDSVYNSLSGAIDIRAFHEKLSF